MPIVSIDPGTLIFTNAFKRKQNKDAQTTITPKMLACLVIGERDSQIWTTDTLINTLHSMGIIYSDDVLECFGPEEWEKFKLFLHKKYVEPLIAAQAKEKSNLILPS